MLKNLVISLIGGLAIFPCFASQADSVVELNNLMSKLGTLQVNFQLAIRDEQSNELLDENSGTLTLKRPGFFHVHTKEPFEQFIISDRKVIWTYDVELEQATQEPIDSRLQQTPFLLLSGDVEAIRQHFSVQAPIINPNSQQFTLSPKDANASYDNVVLDFDGEGILTGMIWHNSLGEKNSIQFSDIKVNQSVPETLFAFQPPAGVDVQIKTPEPSAQP